STWFNSGISFVLELRSFSLGMLKFETPMCFTSPCFLASRNIFQVSIIGASSKDRYSPSFLGDSDSGLKATGQWIKYKSRYSSLRSLKDSFRAGITSSFLWALFQSFEVIHNSSRFTFPW